MIEEIHPTPSASWPAHSEVLAWVREALHASHTDERHEHEEAIKRLRAKRSAVYAAVGGYALNTGRMFKGDPVGISGIALRRRTDNMLSQAPKGGHHHASQAAPHEVDGTWTEARLVGDRARG